MMAACVLRVLCGRKAARRLLQPAAPPQHFPSLSVKQAVEEELFRSFTEVKLPIQRCKNTPLQLKILLKVKVLTWSLRLICYYS